MSGHIKIDRRILHWGWYKNGNTLRLFLHLLLKANWKDGWFQGVEIPRGSLASSYQNLAEKTGMSIQNVRTAVKNLKSTGELTVTRYAKFSVFTIKNYDRYQTANTEPNIYLTDNQQASNSQLTTIEEDNKAKQKKGRREKGGVPVPPTLENVREYCRDHGLVVDADRFFNHYASRGWMSGNTRITDWKGKLRDWDRQDRKVAGGGGVRARRNGFLNFEQRDYDMDELERQLLESQEMEDQESLRLLENTDRNAPAVQCDRDQSGSEGGEK